MSADRALAFYRVLLRLLPRDVRVERGPEMERLFADMRGEWEVKGKSPGWSFWAPLVWDIVSEALGAWTSRLGDVPRSLAAMTRGEPMSTLWSDVRFAARQLGRQPLYALTIVFLMAVGIAGNTAVFRVFNGLFLKPLPFERSERLVDLDETAPSWDLEYLSIAFRDFDAWREQNQTFEAMAVYGFGGGNFLGDGSAQRVTYLRTTHDMDDVLGIRPQVGRFYGPEEDHPDAARVMLISEGFWEQEFARDPDVLGRTYSLSGVTVEVIGVLPPEARFFGQADLWIPLRADPADFDGWGLNGVGLLAEGATIEQARDDLMAVHKGLIPQWEVNEISSPVVSRLPDRYLGEYRLRSRFLLGAVIVVLLIACANIAGLMTARALSRGPEMSVRAALGAKRGRLVRQLLTESLVLAGIGGALGVGLGVWGSEMVVEPLADQFPAWVAFDLDVRFLAFTVLATVVSALVFGLAPALQSARAGSVATGAGRQTASAGRRRAMGLLVAGEVALALALLVVGGLSVLDVRRVAQADPGFDPTGLVTYALGLPNERYGDAAARLAFHEQYLERLEAIPGVEAAATASSIPIAAGHWGWFFSAEGAPARASDEANPVVLMRIVSPGYLDAMGVRLVAGRPFDDFDGRDEGNPVLIVNETFVRTHLSHLDDPVGARVHPGTDAPDEDATWWTVIGVTAEVKHYGLDQEMRPGVYQPMSQRPLTGFNVALRVATDVGPVMAAARQATAEMDVELPLFGILTMREQLDTSLWTRRALSWLIAAFSTVALLLALAGIYGVISYTVGQRGQEISIRMAMGAERRTVLVEVVRHGMVLVGTGALVGLGLAVAGAGLVGDMLVDVSAMDARVYVAVTMLVLAVATVANYVPARRAARLDPMRALRGD